MQSLSAPSGMTGANDCSLCISHLLPILKIKNHPCMLGEVSGVLFYEEDVSCFCCCPYGLLWALGFVCSGFLSRSFKLCLLF